MNAVAKPAVNPWLIAVIVSMATFMEVLDTTITNVSLSHIAGTLGAGQEEGTWVLTSYLVANGIILPLSGWLSGVMGRKRFFLMCVAGFSVASFACGLATSLPALIVFRLLQGLAGGGLQPTQQAIMVDLFPPEKRGTAFAVTGLTMIVAPILGPTLGGWITDNFDWRWIFFINLPVGILAFLLIQRLYQDPPHALGQSARHVDYIGLALVAIGLGCLQIVMDKGQQEDWFESVFILRFAIVSAACLFFAVPWLLRQENPLVDLRLLQEKSFSISCVLIFFVGFVLYSSSALLPLMLQSRFGYDATTAGLVLSPGGLAVVFLMPIAGKLVAKVDAKKLVAVGLLLCAIGMFHTMHITPQTDYKTFVFMRITQVLGLPFLFIPVSTLAFMKIAKEKSNKASALFSLSRNLGGSIGIALAATYYARHTQIHQVQLASNLYAGNVQTEAAIHQSGLAAVYQELLRQASFLSYRDTFLAMGLIMMTGILLTFLLPKNKSVQK